MKSIITKTGVAVIFLSIFSCTRAHQEIELSEKSGSRFPGFRFLDRFLQPLKSISTFFRIFGSNEYHQLNIKTP